MTETRAHSDIAIPPGELLSETLEFLQMSQAELARRADRPVQVINEIVRGSKEITPETALQLERILGVPAHIWLRLEADYRENLARLRDAAKLDAEADQAEQYPYKQMAALGWVPNVKNPRSRVQELLKFFRVNSLRSVASRDIAVAWRKSTKTDAAAEALMAWLMRGEREAEGISPAPFDRARLQASIGELRVLTRKEDRGVSPQVIDLLTQCGVALVFVPHLPGTGVQGATQWVGQKAVVQLSVRYKWSDIFWFSLFHEIGHLLLHHHRGVFVNPDAARGERSHQEREADQFAMNELIPPTVYQIFVRSSNVRSESAVTGFARDIGVSPSIVVGRLQYDRHVPYSTLNRLRVRFELIDR